MKGTHQMGRGSVCFGELFDSDGVGRVSLSRYRGNARAPRHRHDQWYVTLVIGGGFNQSSASDVDAAVGHLVVVPAGEWHSDCVSSAGALCLNLHLEAQQAEWLYEFRGRVRPRARSVGAQLASELAKGPSISALAIESLTCKLAGALAIRRERNVPEFRLQSVLDALESDPIRPWSYADLAAIAGVHRSYLAGQFRRLTGSSIGDYRRRRILTRLCLELRHSKRDLAELANDYGFADQPHMTRAIRDFTGIAPGGFRLRFDDRTCVQD